MLVSDLLKNLAGHFARDKWACQCVDLAHSIIAGIPWLLGLISLGRSTFEISFGLISSGQLR